jgi:Cysteine dioxygenase type I
MAPPGPPRLAVAAASSVTVPERRSRLDPREVASHLAPSVRWPGALDTRRRAWRLMARTPEFDAWLIAWPKGGKVELHDHGASTGAVSVIRGALVEAVPRHDDAGHLTLVRRELRAGATLGFGAGHVHDVTNESDEHALSLHVYSPALTSMTYYELAGDELVASDVAWSTDGSGEFEHERDLRTVSAEAAAAR